jgi:hypothetical protein
MQSFFDLFTRYLAEKVKNQTLCVAFLACVPPISACARAPGGPATRSRAGEARPRLYAFQNRHRCPMLPVAC